MSVSKHLLSLALFGALCMPGAIFAQDAAPTSEEEKKEGEATAEEKAAEEKKEEEKAEEKKDDAKTSAQNALATGAPIVNQDRNWTFSAFMQTSVGQGTFVNPTDDTELSGEVGDGSNAFERVNLAYGVGPSYTIGDFIVSGSVSWTTWLTQGGGSNEPGETRISDVSFDVFWLGHTFAATGTNINLDGGISLPTSQASRYSTMIVDTFLTASVRQPVLGRRLFLIGSLSGGKTFHEFTSPVLDANTDKGDFNEDVLFRANGAEDLGDGLIAIDGRNTEYALSGSIGANIIVIPGSLNASMGYGFTTFWSYAAGIEGQDELTNPNADTGRGVGQLASGRIGLSYQVNENFILGVNARSAQAPKTADNASFRFPFWNFTGAALNASSLGASVRFIY